MIVLAILLIFLVIAAPAGIARWMIRLRPYWSPIAQVFVAAAPLPVILASPGLWMSAAPMIGVVEPFGSGQTDGYREMFAGFALMGAVLAYAIGLISAAIAVSAPQ